MEKERNSFSGTLGFIMAAAASAVGLGNIWRFPYLAARDGGGLFLLTYFILAITFGFTLLITEIAIGRKTKESALTAYSKLNKKAKPLGVLACIVPGIILPYYCTIGGWVLKYFFTFLTGEGDLASNKGFFADYVSDISAPIATMCIFLAITLIVVLGGVEKGIEGFSKIIMPLLVILIMIIAGFSLTLSYTDGGVVRTGLEGFKILVVPDLSEINIHKLLSTMIDATGQLFYSLSIAMGVMIAYGSYMRDDTNLTKSIGMIEIFDTGIAFLAGVMIIPAVYVFMGKEGMNASGPELMFITLPRVFDEMGIIGEIVGCIFFAMVLFAAITSSVSMMEAVVSSLIDGFHLERKNAVLIEGFICFVLGIVVCLGYNIFYFEATLPNGADAQILDIMDYISNSLMMPLISIGTCILIGWVMEPQLVIDESTKNGERFGRKSLYIVMIKYIVPLMLIVLLIKATGLLG